ncbi:MAG TPA: hypothetical protein DDW36_01810 [Candidatus Magasanikbacteria bacterium]|nr:hypothetical protein [Candidatus Magasanikbacteria bacterium]
MPKINVMVLQGGQSSEHDISLNTARQVTVGLNPEHYNVRSITITREGKWLLPHDPVVLSGGASLREKHGKQAIVEVDHGRALEKAKEEKTDIIFIALHGGAGEDGRIQALLELVGLPYTGSGPLASALAMDKVRSADMYRAHGLHVPFSFHFTKNLWEEQRALVLEAIERRVLRPWVVKPADQGSSVGVSIVGASEDLTAAIEHAAQCTRTIIIQQYINGPEATCSIVEKESGELVALPPTRIMANAGAFYDYKSKYATGGSTHVCPADFDEPLNKAIQEAAVTAHRALGCSGMSRTDVIVGDDGVLYVLETNTIPGMTPTSLLPEAAKAAGIDFSELLDMLIKRGLKQRHY